MRIVPLIKFCTNQALQLRPAIGVLFLSPAATLVAHYIVPRALTGLWALPTAQSAISWTLPDYFPRCCNFLITSTFDSLTPREHTRAPEEAAYICGSIVSNLNDGA
jgi:hypothetical protein